MTMARLTVVLRKRGMNLVDAVKLGFMKEESYWTKMLGEIGAGKKQEPRRTFRC